MTPKQELSNLVNDAKAFINKLARYKNQKSKSITEGLNLSKKDLAELTKILKK